MHEVTRVGPKPTVPKMVFRVLSTYLSKLKLGVNLDASITLPNNSKKFQVVIFVHGLGSHYNSYSVIMRELASLGYIVFSLGIVEKIYVPVEGREVRKEALNERRKKVQSLLNMLGKNREFFKLIFPETESDWSFDLDNVHIMGHSFGGATALFTASLDERITGHVIMLDPWYFPLPDDLDLNKLKRPFLCFRADNFDKKFPFYYSDTLMKALYEGDKHKEVIRKSFVCTIKNSGHSSATDISFLLPMENTLGDLMTNANDVVEQYDILRIVTTKFLKEFNVEEFRNKRVLPEVYRDMLIVVY